MVKWLLAALVLTLAGFLFWPKNKLGTQLKVGQTTVAVEIRGDDAGRALGLSGRDGLGDDEGMLFVFDQPAVHEFWMKDMNFPLDFIWINDTRIVDFLKDIQPPKPDDSPQSIPLFAPIVPINRILEVNAGFVETYNIRVGDKIEQVGLGEQSSPI